MAKYSVYMQESLDEDSADYGRGPIFIMETNSLEEAERTVWEYRHHYPKGVCWCEDSNGIIIKVEVK